MPDAARNNEQQDLRIVLGLLESVERDGAQSQRKLAAELGIALGLVNAYLKRCVAKGLVKVRNVPTRRYAYYLTPKGFAEKSRLTVDYLTSSFAFFRRARADCSALLGEARARGWQRIALLGISDLAEIAAICALESGVTIAAAVDLAIGTRGICRRAGARFARRHRRPRRLRVGDRSCRAGCDRQGRGRKIRRRARADPGVARRRPPRQSQSRGILGMRFTQRFALYLLPTVWRLGVSFAVLPLVTYRLGPADYGLYALVISLSNFGGGASGLGAAYPLSAHFQKLDIEAQRDLVSTLLWLGMAVAAAFAALVVAGWPLLGRLVPEAAGVSGSVMWIVAALIVLAAPWNQATAVWLVTGRAGDYAYVGVMESLGTVTATLIALYVFDLGVESLFVGTLVGALSNAAASLTSLRNFLRFRFSRYWMSECFHVGWLSALTSLIDRGKTTLESYALARFTGVATLGIYFHSQLYMNVTRYGLVNAVNSATWPTALHEARAGRSARFPNLGRIWPAAQVGLALAALAMATLGGDFIGLLTHGKFNAAHVFAALWIVVIMFESASMPAVALMYAHDHGVANQRVVLLGGVLSLVLMIPLIAWLGAYGAILAQFIGVLVYRALVFVLARRVSPFPFQDRTLLIGAAVVLAASGGHHAVRRKSHRPGAHSRRRGFVPPVGVSQRLASGARLALADGRTRDGLGGPGSAPGNVRYRRAAHPFRHQRPQARRHRAAGGDAGVRTCAQRSAADCLQPDGRRNARGFRAPRRRADRGAGTARPGALVAVQARVFHAARGRAPVLDHADVPAGVPCISFCRRPISSACRSPCWRACPGAS